jgi:hypothetical protein
MLSSCGFPQFEGPLSANRSPRYALEPNNRQRRWQALYGSVFVAFDPPFFVKQVLRQKPKIVGQIYTRQ